MYHFFFWFSEWFIFSLFSLLFVLFWCILCTVLLLLASVHFCCWCSKKSKTYCGAREFSGSAEQQKTATICISNELERIRKCFKVWFVCCIITMYKSCVNLIVARPNMKCKEQRALVYLHKPTHMEEKKENKKQRLENATAHTEHCKQISICTNRHTHAWVCTLTVYEAKIRTNDENQCMNRMQ